jgi:enoyl-CoA hydratase/carnithine racemase
MRSGYGIPAIRIAILSFKSKMHTIGIDVLEGVQQAIKEAEQNWRALVIWQTEPPFSAGANLQKATEKPKADAHQSNAPPAAPPCATEAADSLSVIPEEIHANRPKRPCYMWRVSWIWPTC